MMIKIIERTHIPAGIAVLPPGFGYWVTPTPPSSPEFKKHTYAGDVSTHPAPASPSETRKTSGDNATSPRAVPPPLDRIHEACLLLESAFGLPSPQNIGGDQHRNWFS